MIDIIFSLSVTILFILYFVWLVHQERKKKSYSPFTEKTLRSPGYTLKRKLEKEADALLMPLLTAGYVPLLFIVTFNDNSMTTRFILWLITVVFIICVLVKIKKVFLAAKNLRIGYEGENYTGQELNFLMREGAWVYHDIPYKYGNIDHVVISKAGVYVIETKSVSKPSDMNGVKQHKLKVTKNELIFPHFKTSEPIKQTKRHAEYISDQFKKIGVDCLVFPVIALPGWYVNEEGEKKGFKVINPKNGAAGLKKYMSDKRRIDEKDLPAIVSFFEEIARSVEINSNVTDPNADNNYTLFLQRKQEERKL